MSKEQAKGRIVAIDLMRGMTVAGMILVNNPGSWGHMYAPLQHAEWTGLTPTDLVFPFFLFIMGVSMYLSLSKSHFTLNRQTGWKVLRRTLLLCLIGWVVGFVAIFLRRWFHPDPEADLTERLLHAVDYLPHMRISGVFVRLGLTYGLGALLLMTIPHKRLPALIGATLTGYALLLILGNGYVYGPENILSRIDRAILTENHMYSDNGIDPEGLVSTIPAVMQVLIGSLVGERMMRYEGHRRILGLLISGVLMALVGYLLSGWLPVSKKIWSPTFVLITCGLGATLLGLLVWLTEERGGERYLAFFRPFGANALFSYLASTVLCLLFLYIPVTADGLGIAGLSWRLLSGAITEPKLASLTYSLIFLGINWLIAHTLYKKNLFIKL